MGREARLKLVDGTSHVLSVERPSAFHQSAPADKNVVVPMVMKEDGTPYSVHTSDPHKLYEQTVLLGYPHLGMVHDAFFQSALKMHAASAGKGYMRGAIGESSCNLPLNRNIIMNRFLELPEDQQTDWLLFIDTDIRFPPYTSAVLVKVAVETKADIIAVPYMLTNGCSTFGVKAETGGYNTQASFTFDRAYEIDVAGTGCMMISRALLLKMRERYKHLEPWQFCNYDRIEINGKGEYESDDYSLCHRAQDIGARIIGYTGVVLGHMKMTPLVFEGLRAEDSL